jgi:hypothetical protein
MSVAPLNTTRSGLTSYAVMCMTMRHGRLATSLLILRPNHGATCFYSFPGYVAISFNRYVHMLNHFAPGHCDVVMVDGCVPGPRPYVGNEFLNHNSVSAA